MKPFQRFIFLILSISSVTTSNVGSQALLHERLAGKKDLNEIMTLVEQYFREHPEDKEDKGFESVYTHWKRWEWFMSSHLGPGGEFVNIPEMNMRGLRDKALMQASADRNINSAWTFMGPSTSPLHNEEALFNGIGRVDRIAFHPTDTNIIFIGTPAGGLWNTLNGGASWNNLTDHLTNISISGIVISYADPTIQYLLTGDGDSGGHILGYGGQGIGVLKTMDGGVSWHQTGALPGMEDPFVGYRLAQSPTNPDVLLAATNSGLYYTNNGGTSWIKRVNDWFYDVEFKPYDGSRAYATVQGEFWMSTDGGVTWNTNSTFDIEPASCTDPEGGGRIEIAVCESNVSKVYLLSGPTGSGLFCGLWLSTDSGLSFERQSWTPNILGPDDWGSGGGGQTWYNLAVDCRSDLSTSVITGALTVWRSENGGEDWIHCTSYDEDGIFPYIHPDVHDLAYNPVNDRLYAATDGGFYKSLNHGVTWIDLSPNIETSMFYHLRGWDGNINKLMGGLQDNGVKYRNANSSAFLHILGADGFDVVFNPVNGEPAYSTRNASVDRYSMDGTLSESIPLTEDSIFFKTLAIHNTDPDIFLVGTNDIFKSTNGGDSYTNEGASGSWSLASCPSNSTRFYSAGGANSGSGSGGLYFSANTGDSWTVKSNNTGFPPPSDWSKITDVTVRPINSSTVWACFGGYTAGVKVVMSTNTGDTWTNMSANLPNVPVHCLAIDNDNGAYAGTDIGVFYRGPAMSNWMPWSNALPNVPVTDLFIFDDGTTKRIRAATYGRGVWQSNLASTCDAAVIVTGGLEGMRHYEASTTITSSAFIQGGIGTFVSFKSGDYITLSEGFNVADDSEFLGFISPCGQGGIPSAQDEILINRADPGSSIIPLRRMWNPQTGLPYGAIENIEVENNIAHITFSIRQPGRVQFYAARDVQEKLVTIYSGETESGKHDLEFDLSGLPDALYYLLLFYDGKLAHFQELVRR